MKDTPKIFPGLANAFWVIVAWWMVALLAVFMLMAAFLGAAVGPRWDITLFVVKEFLELMPSAINLGINFTNIQVLEPADHWMHHICHNGKIEIRTGQLIDDLENLFDIGNITITGMELFEGAAVAFDILKVDSEILFDEGLILIKELGEGIVTLLEIPQLTGGNLAAEVVADVKLLETFFTDLYNAIETGARELVLNDTQIITSGFGYAPFESGPGPLNPDNQTLVLPPINTQDQPVNSGNDAGDFLNGDIFTLTDKGIIINYGLFFCLFDNVMIPTIDDDFLYRGNHSIIKIIDDFSCIDYADPLTWIYRGMQLLFHEPAVKLSEKPGINVHYWICAILTLFILSIPILMIPCCCRYCVAVHKIEFDEEGVDFGGWYNKFVHRLHLFWDDKTGYDKLLDIIALVITVGVFVILFLLYFGFGFAHFFFNLYRDFINNMRPEAIPGFIRISVPILGYTPPDTLPFEPLFCMTQYSGVPIFLVVLLSFIIGVIGLLGSASYWMTVVLFHVLYLIYVVFVYPIVFFIWYFIVEVTYSIPIFVNAIEAWDMAEYRNEKWRNKRRRASNVLRHYIRPNPHPRKPSTPIPKIVHMKGL